MYGILTIQWYSMISQLYPVSWWVLAVLNVPKNKCKYTCTCDLNNNPSNNIWIKYFLNKVNNFFISKKYFFKNQKLKSYHHLIIFAYVCLWWTSHAVLVNEHARRSRTTLFVFMFNLCAAARCSVLLPLLTRVSREQDSSRRFSCNWIRRQTSALLLFESKR